ncbi:Ig-like domain-containing protein [Kitasatospora sp. MBT63]|uniref:Ig-like domain-containing protein n=1 Tax=Kitasatospora sp. MBT63 TaxID=1444768 RepID=UPI00068C840D|nr:Ig-like domain-containing protein [Kitasatospora sp. MBT63]
MSTYRIPRAVALGAATVLAAGSITLLGSAAAYADTVPVIGTLSVNPATGADDELMNVVSSGSCNGGTNLQLLVFGQGFPTDGYGVTPNVAQSVYSPDAQGRLSVPLSDTMRSFAQKNGFSTLSGQYEFHLRCRAKIGATYFGDFVGSVWFTSPTAYTSTDPNAPVAQATTTTLSVTPTGSATVGSDVTLTAAVSPTAAGTVQFFDGATAVGAPATVAAGQATATVNTLAEGAHTLKAVFTSTDSHFLGSTSANVSYTISPKGAQATTTGLVVSPAGSAAKGASVKLSASVAPAAAGTVEFKDNGTVIGSQPVAAGAAEFSTTALAEGDHQLTAAFTPADATQYAASASAAVPFTVTPQVTPPNPGGPTPPAPVSETITTTVAPGALVISVAGANVTLPPLTLNNDSTRFATAGPIQTVTVTDTRAGAPGWSVSGQVAQFSSGTGSINAQNLGWAPNLVSKGDGLKVTLGGQVAPANAVEVNDGGALGLKSSRTLATATGLGTAKVGADLTLLAPTSTVAGTYQGVLTLTAI